MITEIWQRYFVRGPKNPKSWVFYVFLITGILMYVQFKYNDSIPLLDLDQLEKRTGILVDVYQAGRAKAPWIVLENSGGKFRYYFTKSQLPEIKKHIGQEVVVWSQAKLNFGRFRFEDTTRQVQIDGELIQDYAKVRPFIEAVRAKKSTDVFYVFPLFFVLWGLIALWRMNPKAQDDHANSE